jgi:hypothetical protein
VVNGREESGKVEEEEGYLYSYIKNHEISQD